MFGYKKLLAQYNKIVFISPHLDDAILSCGQLISELVKLKKKIQIISIFTKGSLKTITPQAKHFLNACGYESAVTLFRDRQNEDKNMAKRLGLSIKHLNFTDAAWRTDRKLNPIYRDAMQQFGGVASEKDSPLVNSIRSKLSALIKKKHDQPLVFGPLGIGGHVDHVLTRNVLAKMNISTLFWEDFPYNTSRETKRLFFSQTKEFKTVFSLFYLDSSRKTTLINFYKSQAASLFPNRKIPHVKEGYYYLKSRKPF